MGTEEKYAYIFAQALQLKSQLNIPSVDLLRHYKSKEELLDLLWAQHETTIRAILSKSGDDHLGRIICGTPALYVQESHTRLVYEGRMFALEFAAQGIVAALGALLWAEVQKAKAEAEADGKYIVCKYCGWKVSKSATSIDAFARHFVKEHPDEARDIFCGACEEKREDEIFWPTKHP